MSWKVRVAFMAGAYVIEPCSIFWVLPYPFKLNHSFRLLVMARTFPGPVLVSCSNPSSNGGKLLARGNHWIIIDKGVKKSIN